MLRKILTTALLCLAFASTAEAQPFATLYEAFADQGTVSQIVLPSSVRLFFHRADIGYDEGDGNIYHYCVGTYCYHAPTTNTLYLMQRISIIMENASGFAIVPNFPVLLHPREPVSYVTATGLTDGTTFIGNGSRYFCTYDDLVRYVAEYNAHMASISHLTNRAACVAEYGFDIPAGTAFRGTSLTQLDPSMLTRDRDGGGVPDWFEVIGNRYQLGKTQDKTDDHLCFCMPCCSCRCVCGHWNPDRCDGTTHDETGCRCHDENGGPDPEDPDDPDEPETPVMSKNVPPLLRSVLFLVCLLCGAGFFGSFIDSFEKGSF